MINIFFVIFLIFFSYNAFAQKISYNMCIKVSQQYNKDLPIKMNKYNTLVSTYCSRTNGAPTIHYIYNTKFTKPLKGETKKMVNRFCSDSGTRKMLDLLKGVELNYFSPNGNKLQSIRVTSHMCD